MFNGIDQYQNILVVRPDAAGDVVLIMPLCGIIKKYFPTAKITLMGISYTMDVAGCCEHIDGFLNVDDWNGKTDDQIVEQIRERNFDTVLLLPTSKWYGTLMKKAGIRYRVGTVNRWYYWFLCNRLVRLTRRNSPLHEAQLHTIILKGIGIHYTPELKSLERYYGFNRIPDLNPEFKKLLSKDKFNLILHPKTSGNAPEWSLAQFSELVKQLDKSKVQLFVTGSPKEKEDLIAWLKLEKDNVIDVTGIFSLSQFISFISNADGLIAGSTGPVHIAAASGIHALGLYCNTNFKFAKRWRPIGKQAEYLSSTGDDLSSITPTSVLTKINNWLN